MKRRELEEKRTRNSKLFENQDHSFTREIYLDPIHYKEDDGTWKEMDNTITEEAEPEETAELQEQNREVQKDFVNKKVPGKRASRTITKSREP